MSKKKKTMLCLCCMEWKPEKTFHVCGSCYLRICEKCAFDFMLKERKELFCIDCFIHEMNRYYDFGNAEIGMVSI